MKKAYDVERRIAKPGYPYKQAAYSKVNAEADVAEKKRHPAGYEKLKALDKKLPRGEFAGTISKSGKVKVSEKVPKKLRQEVAEHDKDELKRLKKK